jgi:hypothetical protein
MVKNTTMSAELHSAIKEIQEAVAVEHDFPCLQTHG